MSLTDVQMRGAKLDSKPKKISDSGQLYLLVYPNGSKLWKMNYQHEGKQETLSFRGGSA